MVGRVNLRYEVSHTKLSPPLPICAGKQLLAWDDPELAEQLKSRIKPTLHEVGRLVDGDIDAHVEQVLARAALCSSFLVGCLALPPSDFSGLFCRRQGPSRQRRS